VKEFLLVFFWLSVNNSFKRCKVTDEGLIKFGKALREMSLLEYLNLDLRRYEEIFSQICLMCTAVKR